MGKAGRGAAWVFHAGALGDFVMIWPFIRSLARRFDEVNIVTDSAKAALARACIVARSPLIAHDGNHRRFSRLWTGNLEGVDGREVDAVLVMNFVADPAQSPAWSRAAALMFPEARVRYVGAPGSDSRAAAWDELVSRSPEARDDHQGAGGRANGPIVCHVGAGGESKRWPLDHWRELARISARRMVFVAGEVEAERFTGGERAAFAAMGGRFGRSLMDLAAEVRLASAVVGADSGPAHLAAQLGVPTVALFGPTDWRTWSPVGPRIRVVAPETPMPMTWITPAMVDGALQDVLGDEW